MIGTIMHFEEDVITFSWICIILHDHPMAENNNYCRNIQQKYLEPWKQVDHK